MTFEEIQQTIEGMLRVQRELQTSQIELKDRQDRFHDEMEELKQRHEDFSQRQERFFQEWQEISRSTERKLDRLIGYSISQEGDILDVKQEIMSLKARMSALEEGQQGGQSQA